MRSTGPRRTILLLGVLLMAVGTDARAAEWAEITTVEQLCAAQPEDMRDLLAAMDLEREGLAGVRAAFEADDLVVACSRLLAYYREGDTGSWLREEVPAGGDARHPKGDAILEDRFVFYQQEDSVPRRADGGHDWDHRGPANDQEWAWALNRHFHIRDLVRAWQETGNPEYAAAIDRHLRDWILHSGPYPGKRSSSSMWRGLEISFRAKAWTRCFHALQDSPQFTPAARLLMLRSLLDHADYLRRFHGGGNWLTMELSGLAAIATRIPEFRRTGDDLDYAGKRLLRELDKQVYPDGAQMELTASYHWVALNNFEQFLLLCEAADRPVDEAYRTKLMAMYHYLAKVLRPNGTIPLNNDADLGDYRPRLLTAAERYDRPEWAYAASGGSEGQRPEDPPSRFMPWAGQLVSRSGWDGEAHWSFFDVGPYGTSHQHADKLHLSVQAGGRDLLVDSGRFAYRGDLAVYRSRYGVRSRAHNVILFDDHEQKGGPKQVRKPLGEDLWQITPEFDFARGSFDDYHGLEPGQAVHTRAVCYVRDNFWVVVDRVTTREPRQVTAFWHWHPDCTVELQDGRVASVDPEATNLALQPIGDVPWEIALVSGRKEGEDLQGWYSARYNSVEANQVAQCSARLEGTRTFAWLLVPERGAVPAYEATLSDGDEDLVTVEIALPDGSRCRLRLPITGDAGATTLVLDP